MSYRKKHIKRRVRLLKPKKSLFKKPLFWWFVLFLFVVLSIFYFFVFYPKFQITEIIISGNEKVLTQDIEKIVKENIDRKIFVLAGLKITSKSIFLTGPKIISKALLNGFSQIESVKVSKKFPQTITLQVKERTPFAVFCQTDDKKCFYIDENGIIFKILEKIPENISIVRQLIEDKEVFTGERVVEKNIIDIISKIKRNLKDNFQIDVKSAMISTPFRLNIETSENWQIYFNLESETDLQIAKMNLLLKDEISVSARKTLQYIDLRFKDRAYYK